MFYTYYEHFRLKGIHFPRPFCIYDSVKTLYNVSQKIAPFFSLQQLCKSVIYFW